MPCFHPLQAYRARFLTASGKRPLTFTKKDGLPGSSVQIPCRQCIGCRLNYSRQWAIRCYHESQLHEDNSFITLTYDDDHLPFGGTLVKDEISKFFKRLRKLINPKILHFSCGEYGDENDRPHYHSCIFGYAFPDRYHWETKEGIEYYRSEILERAWPFGQTLITDFTFKTAAYVARYVVKKITGDDAQLHYERVHLDTGEIFNLLPEYSRQSLRPAIAKQWWEKFGKSVTDWDTVVVDGKELPPPRYYDLLSDETELQIRKLSRISKAQKSPDNTLSRRLTREKSAHLKLQQLKRSL